MLEESPILWILIGIAGAGKTTYAEKIWKKNPKRTLRVCLDDIIQMLSFYSYDENVTPIYSSLEESTVVRGLVYGYDVIVDRTNLTRSVRQRFIAMGEMVRSLARELSTILNSIKMTEEEIALYLDEQLEEEMREVNEAFKGLIRTWFAKREAPLIDAPVPLPEIEEHFSFVSRLKIFGVFFDVPKDVALMRRMNDPQLFARERVTGRIEWRKVVERMVRIFEPPSTEEGFDRLLRVNEIGEEEAIG